MSRIVLILALSAVSQLSMSAFAFAHTCDGTARGAAEDFMAQRMDMACAEAKATIVKKFDDVRADGKTRTIYELDVVCGGSHFDHQVIVLKSTCEVLVGGGGDA